MKVRYPAYAGMFYAGTLQTLKTQIEGCFTHKFGPGRLPKVRETGPRELVGLVCPHAGYMYSGPVAAHAYYALAEDGIPKTVVILGPNHTSRGSLLSIVKDGVWRTPLGDVEVNSEIAERIWHESKIIDVDESAHTVEHAIEVQLPFLQYLYGTNFKLIPICFFIQDLETSVEVGETLSKVLTGEDAVIIASTDMTHYEPKEVAEQKDKMIINAITKLEEQNLYSIVQSRGLTICGYGPTIALMTAMKSMRVKETRLLCYKTSGDVIGDFSSVVGYASISFRQ